MRKFLFVALAFSALSLQGCFPVIATGVGTGVLMVEDRRTSGTFIEDQSTELKIVKGIDEKFGDKVNINTVSYNRIVLLTGEAPTDEMRSAAEAIARSQPNVRNVINEVVISAPTSFASHSHDAYLTSKVKARFVDANKFQVNHVKVITENSVVYLLGLVKRQEADDAVEVASTTDGVTKVVKLFEYLD